MLPTLPSILLHQYEASLSMLNLAIERCPADRWNEPIAKWKFCQAAFHVVFFADAYLQPSDDVEALKRQPFHLDHAADFRDYEEFEDREPVLLYEKDFVKQYLQHVRRKANETLDRDSADVLDGLNGETVLAGPSGFRRRDCSRAELHLYNIRHIQHHAAQLILRLRLDTDVDVPWVGHAWNDA